ncbi:MAG: pyridoxal phosphate-dependent aminotransferase [Hyphomicrobiaceae bacterium]
MPNTAPPHPLVSALTPSARRLPESGIVKVFNYGRTREGLVPLWAGEGDMPTPPFIADAAAKALAAGETFYTYQRGIPPLREALADYFARLYGRPMSADEFFVTCGGMQAIQMAVQLVVGEGDEVVVPSPAWPNFEGAITARGGAVRYVPMELKNAGWVLDLDRLFAAVGPKTRALFINSPSNPTGWTASTSELKAILDFARARGLWIIADEIYGRFHFAGAGKCVHGDLAPSFQNLREDDDRILFVQTFSKMWAMTGWRMGWLQAPAALGQVIENLIQYNTSGVAPFMQRAGVEALASDEGEAFAKGQIARAAAGRTILADALKPFNSVRFAPPAGAFYQFFAIEGLGDSTEAALRLVDEANIGLAPGAAFGPGGEGHFRICFLRSGEGLAIAMDRLTDWLERR